MTKQAKKTVKRKNGKVVRKRRPGAGRPKASAPDLPRITPLEGISAERQVYEALRYSLMSGGVLPNAGLTLRSLSEAMGVSLTPVREALKRLEADGALVSRSKSAFFVYAPDKSDFAQITDIRLKLEGHAIRCAALEARDKDLDSLRRINDQYRTELSRDKISTVDTLQVNFRFHFEVYKLSGSPILTQMIETLWLRIGPTLQRDWPADSDISTTIFHDQMLDALARNDPDAAETALHNDLTAAYREILPFLRDS